MPSHNPLPPIVLIHGFRGAPLGLETIAEDLRQAGYDVYLPPIPPFAGAKLQAYSPDDYAQYLRDYIETNHLVRPVLIGHSMGSIIATATAQRYPQLVNQKLILLSPISTRTPRFVAWVAPCINYLPSSIVDYITTKFLFVPHDAELFHKTLKLTHQCSNDHPPRKSELSAACHFSTKYSVADFLENLPQNITCIAGDKDKLIKSSATKKLAKRHHMSLEFISDSGHLHNYEKPHETAALILQALK